MFKQFSFLTPLQTSEREIKMVEKKYKKSKFNINKYRESNWINAWGSTPKMFSIIPLLNSKPYKTAEFLKPVKKKIRYNFKQKSLIKLNCLQEPICNCNFLGTILDNVLSNIKGKKVTLTDLILDLQSFHFPVEASSHLKNIDSNLILSKILIL